MGESELNFMFYNGQHLFHYTTLKAAEKILETRTLKFGTFKKTNDLAERVKDLFCNLSSKELKKAYRELGKYKFISFTRDAKGHRGFAIDSLWGYYADKGKGACLVFDKEKIVKAFKSISASKSRSPISYRKDGGNAIFTNVETLNDVKKDMFANRKNVFFTKSDDWAKEREYRLLAYSEEKAMVLPIENALLAVILFSSDKDKFRSLKSYKLLSGKSSAKILQYIYQLGNKELLDEEYHTLYPVYRKDYELE